MKAAAILGYLVILGLVFLIIHLFVGIRRKKMAAYAESKGWSFSPAKNKGMDKLYPDFKCLRRGHSRYARNIMRGTHEGWEITAFDYHYATGAGKSRRDYNFSALIVNSPIPLKSLYVRPESLFDKVTDFFGFDDIDFESAEFSRKFFVKAEDKRWAYHVIHQRMMELLLQAPRFSFQFDPGHIITWRRKRFSEEDFDNAFELTQGIMLQIPEYVKKQQQELKN